MLGVGLGLYLGNLQEAKSASSAPRIITLRSQDIAIYGNLRCLANFEARSRTFLCSRRPRSGARYETAIWPNGDIYVFRMGNPDPIYSTP